MAKDTGYTQQAKQNILARHGDPEDGLQLLREVSKLKQQDGKFDPPKTKLTAHEKALNKAFDYSTVRNEALANLAARGISRTNERALMRELQRLKKEEQAKVAAIPIADEVIQ